MKHPHEDIYVQEIANVKRNYMMTKPEKEAKVKELEQTLAGLRRNREEE